MLPDRAVVAIINATPDSFYTGCGVMPDKEALRCAILRAVEEGADLLDIGGCSTRPDSLPPSVEEEWQRVVQALAIAREVAPDLPLSVDTYRSEVARRAIEEYDVAMINDISGGTLDGAMWSLVAQTGVLYVATHLRGEPTTMQRLAIYSDVVEEVATELGDLLQRMTEAGIAPRQLILDPGFGFAKDAAQNYALVAGLERLKGLGCPLMVGISRKSMLYKPLGLTPDEVLPATTALHWELLQRGANYLRVHDVAAARQTIDLYTYYAKTTQL